jgi:hypothetical protein
MNELLRVVARGSGSDRVCLLLLGFHPHGCDGAPAQFSVVPASYDQLQNHVQHHPRG